MNGAEPWWGENWIAAVNADLEFQMISRWTQVRLYLSHEHAAGNFAIEGPHLGRDPNREMNESVVRLRGSMRAWHAFLQPYPAPNSHHVLAMDRRRKDFEIAGGRHELVRHLRVVNRVLELMRSAATPEPER